MRPRLVCLIEGDGEEVAVPTLVKKVVKDQPFNPWNEIRLDDRSQRLGDYSKLAAKGYDAWARHLKRLAMHPTSEELS